MIDAVRQAVRLCQDVQQNALQNISKYSEQKGSSEPVTVGDYGAQAIIGRALKEHFSQDAVIAEESGTQFVRVVGGEARNDVLNRISRVLDAPVSEADAVEWLDFGKERKADRTWVIDPIDGTKGFLAGRHYAVCVGYLEDGVPMGAVMACPHYNDGEGAIFYVENGRVFQQPLFGTEVRERTISTRQNPSEWVAVQSFEDANTGKKDAIRVLEEAHLLPQVRVRDVDSMEKYALVAVGDADMMIRLPRGGRSTHMIWDHVAGVALVLAGGGIATDYDGSPLDFTKGAGLPNEGMMVSSGIMHEQLVRAARQLVK